MLYIIGIGLSDEKDITVKGLELVKQADKIYLESYTSKIQCSIEQLEKFYNKSIIKSSRADIENNSSKILEEAKSENIVILVIGSPTAATTHMTFLEEAKKANVKVSFIENSSILTAIGITGLSLYKFGKTITIPLDNKNLESIWKNYLINKKADLHTLFLLDIQDDKLMSCKEALDYLISQGLDPETKVVACAALGSEKQQIQYAKTSEISVTNFPQSLIIPSKLNFMEENILKLYE